MLIMMPTPSAYIARVKRVYKAFTSALVAKCGRLASMLAMRSSIDAMYSSFQVQVKRLMVAL